MIGEVIAVFPFALADDVVAVVVRVSVGRVLLDRFEVIFGPAAGDVGDRLWVATRFGGVEPEHVLEHFRGQVDDALFVVEVFVHRRFDVAIDIPAGETSALAGVPAFHIVEESSAPDADQVLFDVMCVGECRREFVCFGSDVTFKNEEHLIVGLHGKPICAGVCFGWILLIIEGEDGGDFLCAEPFGIVLVFFRFDGRLRCDEGLGEVRGRQGGRRRSGREVLRDLNHAAGPRRYQPAYARKGKIWNARQGGSVAFGA